MNPSQSIRSMRINGSGKSIASIMRLILCILLTGVLNTASADTDSDLTKVTYRLKWLRNMSTVGDLYAATHGLFAARGLAVTVKPGGPEIDAIRELELGQADFGVASADQVIRAAAKGSPVVVIAQLFQVNPLQWIYRSDRSAVRKPGDLAGKTVGVTFGKNDEVIMRTLLVRANVRDDQVRLFSVRLDYTPFFDGTVDLWPVYINTQGVEIGAKLESAGEKFAFFNPNEHGVRFVANSVVTSRRFLTRNPELARSFVSALLDGWQRALDPKNTRLAIAAVRKYDKDTNTEVIALQLERTRRLIMPTPNTILGSIDRNAWVQTEAMMKSHNQIDRQVDISRRLMPLIE